MKIKVNYYGLIADLIGISDEDFELNFNESNELDLRSIFNHKYPALLKINYKIALDTEFTETINRNSIPNEISLLPPFAGG